MLIGLDRVVAAGRQERCATRGGATHGPLQTVRQLDVKQLADDNTTAACSTSARSTEWREGHMRDAEHFYLGDSLALSRDLPRDTPIAVHCQGGTRSAIAASLLQAQGFTNVANVAGGIQAWTAAGLPVEPICFEHRPITWHLDRIRASESSQRCDCDRLQTQPCIRLL